jgi:hypothetical protein
VHAESLCASPQERRGHSRKGRKRAEKQAGEDEGSREGGRRWSLTGGGAGQRGGNIHEPAKEANTMQSTFSQKPAPMLHAAATSASLRDSL